VSFRSGGIGLRHLRPWLLLGAGLALGYGVSRWLLRDR
jgi:hypothetical protein